MMKTTRSVSALVRAIRGASPAIVLLAAGSVWASSQSWTGGGSDSLWSDTSNWSGTPIPGTGDTATFNAAAGAGGATIDLGTGVTANTVLFDTNSAAAYTIGNLGLNVQALTINDTGAVTMNATVATNEALNSSVLLGTATASTYTFTNNSTTNTLTFAGNIQGGTGGTAAAKTLTIAGAGNTILGGTVANGGASSLALTQNGAGTLTFSGLGSYTGATNVSTGTFSLSGVLGGATTITVSGGTNLSESTSGVIGLNNAAVLVVSGTATLLGSNTYTGATTVNSGGVLNIQNAIALGTTGAGTTVNSGGALQIQGGIATLGEALTLNGTGISNDGALRNISGINAYDGSVTLATASRINSDAGMLILNGGSVTNGANLLTVGGVGNTSITTVIGTGAGGLTKDGTGTLGLFSANTYTGTTTISNGTILLGSTETAGTSGALGKSIAANPGSILFGGGTLQYSPQNTNDYSGRFATTGSQAISIDTNSRNITFATALQGSGTSLAKLGYGTLTLSVTPSYTGGTTVSNGTLLLSGALNMPATGAVTVNAGGTFSLADGTVRSTQTVASLTLNSGATLAFDGTSAGGFDQLTSTGAATTSGVIGILINSPTLNATGGTILSSSLGGLTSGGAQYFLANNTNYTSSLTPTNTSVNIGAQTTATALVNNAFWIGNKIAGTNTSGIDNAMALSTGAVSNWSTTTPGTAYTATGLVPGSTANVVFATGETQQSNIVLGADMTVNTVTFNDTTPVTLASGNAITLVSAGTGASSAISTNQSATINAGVILGASQT